MNSTWKEKWIEDIEFLKENLIKGHANIFSNITKEQFEENLEALKGIIDELDYDDMKIELSKVVAAIGDAHTAVAFPISRYLPVKFCIFEDGVYIVKVNPQYKDLLYKKVEAIEGVSIEEVLKELSYIISHENQYFLKAQSAKYLQAADVLYGLYICENKDRIKLKINGEDLSLDTVSLKELNYLEVENLPRYARNSNSNFWYEVQQETLYIKYNQCREDGIKALKDKINEAIAIIEKKRIKKVTIDLRNNLGGDSTLIQPLIDYIKNSKELNKKGNLKVIIGRETFSSALLNAYEFKFETNAIIAGEPSGGKPNCYGEILRFTLPNSNFNVSYSTKYYKLIEDDSIMALYPDETIIEGIEDYKNKFEGI